MRGSVGFIGNNFNGFFLRLFFAVGARERRAQNCYCLKMDSYAITNAYLGNCTRKLLMKVKASVKADPSKGDILVRRAGRLYVINKKDPNRKQRQKGPARKK